MSRLIVKNLPKNITESKVRELFSQNGTITDIQLKYTPDGKFRQFAFVGYHNENEANVAIKSLNNTHINTNKIIVEACSILGDSDKSKPWSKYAANSTAYKQNHPELHKQEDNSLKEKKPKKKSKKLEILDKYKDDLQFEEFMQLHAPNDTHLLTKTKEDEEEVQQQDEENDTSKDEEDKLANLQISDAEYMKSLVKGADISTIKKTSEEIKPKLELFTVKLRSLPYNCKKKDIKDFFKPLAPYSIRIPRNIKGIAYVGFKSEKKHKQALLKDRSFIGTKQISVCKFEKEKSTDNSNSTNNKWKNQEEILKNEESIAESGRIFIRNLSYTTTEDDIQELFSKYGPLTETNLPVDSVTRKSKGFGVITFLMPEHAVKAYSELDGTVIHGRMLHLLPGKAKDSPENEQEESTNYKQKKATQQKAQSGSSHNWNSLFMGHDAVADVIAKTYGTSKEAVLNPEGKDSAAVRLALGETQIVATTRKQLEKEGVVLDAFIGTTMKRSKTIILVKNLPADTVLQEIRNLFQKFGILDRLILPSNCITAIVEFIEPSEARKAFTNLAYTKFKHTPLYLEWAPENSLLPRTAKEEVKSEEAVNEVADKTQPEDEDDSEEPEPDTTLFVKNLNFKTTDDILRKHFEVCGKIHYATVATKKDKNDPNNKLSMGYGFVRFMYKAGANKALKDLQCSTLDGKSLELKRSERTLKNEVVTSKKQSKATKQNGTKILVRNVPFQANYKEIMELFKTFGEIKALRLPKKMSTEGNAHRGFAFVDYFTTSDAKKAFEALSQSTHLYGRRLVLEWASTDEGVDDIRKRTAEHFHIEEQFRSKKSVLDIEKT